jgi:hypothetical protein
VGDEVVIRLGCRLSRVAIHVGAVRRVLLQLMVRLRYRKYSSSAQYQYQHGAATAGRGGAAVQRCSGLVLYMEEGTGEEQ